MGPGGENHRAEITDAEGPGNTHEVGAVDLRLVKEPLWTVLKSKLPVPEQDFVRVLPYSLSSWSLQDNLNNTKESRVFRGVSFLSY